MKKILIALILIANLSFAQDTLNIKIVKVQQGIYRLADDPQLNKGVFMYIYGEMLRQKPLTVQEIIARFNLINAIIEAQKEK